MAVPSLSSICFKQIITDSRWRDDFSHLMERLPNQYRIIGASLFPCTYLTDNKIDDRTYFKITFFFLELIRNKQSINGRKYFLKNLIRIANDQEISPLKNQTDRIVKIIFNGDLKRKKTPLSELKMAQLFLLLGFKAHQGYAADPIYKFCKGNTELQSFTKLLFTAAETGNHEVILPILERVMETSQNLKDFIIQKNTKNQTILHLAASSGYLEVVEVSIQHLYKICAPEEIRRFLIEADESRYTALYWAIERGHHGVVDALLFYFRQTGACFEELNALVTRSAGINNRTAFDLAIENGTYEILDILLKHFREAGADLEKIADLLTGRKSVLSQNPILMKLSRGPFILLAAVQSGKWEMVNTLLRHFLEAGANSQQMKFLICDGTTIFYEAAANEHNKIIEILVTYFNKTGASLKELVPMLVDANNCSLYSPLHIAANRGYSEVVHALLQPVITAKKEERKVWFTTKAESLTPLEISVKNRHEKVVDAILFYFFESGGRFEEMPYFHKGYESVVNAILERLRVMLSEKFLQLLQESLCAATQHGCREIVQLILSYKPKADLLTDIGNPIHIAAQYGRTDVIELLLEYGFSLDIKDKNGHTPLHIAACYDRELTVQLLLDRGAKVDEVNSKRQTPLFFAAQRSIRVTQPLINAHANIESKDETGSFSLHAAAWNGPLEVVQLLLQHNADINCKNNSGQTPLHLAANKGKTPVVDDLLARGAKVDLLGFTPLDSAVKNNHRDAAISILYSLRERRVSAEEFSKVLSKALFEAAQSGHKEMVRLLLSHQIKVDQLTDNGSSPLHIAVQYEHIDVIELLLTYGMSPNLEDKNGNSPLHIAARFNREKAMKLLLNRGAVVNAMNSEGGLSPLHLASSKEGHIEMVSFLLSQGARADLSMSNSSSVVRKFIQDGIWGDDSTYANNITPFFLAAWKGKKEILMLLLNWLSTSQLSVKEIVKLLRASLFIAAYEGHEAIEILLLEWVKEKSREEHAKLQMEDALIRAAKNAVVEELNAYLEIASKEAIKQALWAAAQNDHPEIVQIFLQSKRAQEISEETIRKLLDASKSERVKTEILKLQTVASKDV